MNSSVEIALSEVFGEFSTGVVVIPQTGGVIPDNQPFITVECGEMKHVAGPLHDLDIHIVVWTPQLVDAGLNKQTHKNSIATAATFLTDSNALATASKLQADAGLTLQGWYFIESVNDHQDGRWRTDLHYTMAVAKI